MPELTTAPAVPEVNAAQESIETLAAAACHARGCMWYSGGGTEVKIIAAAADHAAVNPGHRVTCQVRQTRTWSVLRSDSTEGE